MKSPHVHATVLLAIVCASGPARAAVDAITDTYEGIREGVPLDVHGLADLYAQSSLASPTARGAVLYRAFDSQAGQPSLGLLHVTLAHRPEVLGLRIDAGFGELANAYLRQDPAQASHPDLSRAFSYVEQAFVTARAPVGRGLVLDVGKFGTPVGIEDNESFANWSYSRSLLFLLAEPSFHSGARLSYAPTPTLSLTGYWLNGWDANVADGNGMRAFAGAATWAPTPKLELVVDYMAGLERAPTRITDPALSFRHELDLYATWELTERIAFASTGDYGRDAARGGVSWWGVGGWMRVQALSWLAGTVRGEHLTDTNGFTSGTKQQLAEITATVETREQAGRVTLIERLEYRRDRSDERVFASSSLANLTHQDTVTAALIAAF